jgi:small GTP-binding protein
MAVPNQVLPRKFDFSLKIVVVGDSGVGKSCFLIRYVRNEFDEEAQPTLGVEFLTKIVKTEAHRIQLQLWDTAGQELFRSVTRGYYRGSAGAIVIFDLTSRDSFDNIAQWLQDIRDVARADVVAVLIGNKSDLMDERNVTKEEAEAFAKANSMQYFETSAKSGSNVSNAVEGVVKIIEKNVNSGAYQADRPPDQTSDFGREGGEPCNC